KDEHGVVKDSVNGSFGRFGILRLMPFSLNGVTHEGVGIHSGRANRGGADHPTNGCIRTTDDVMEALFYYIMNDPLVTVIVMNNHDQYHKHSHFYNDGDSHLSATTKLA